MLQENIQIQEEHARLALILTARSSFDNVCSECKSGYYLDGAAAC